MSFIKDLLKASGNEYASLVSDGVTAGDVDSFIDTGSYIFNALLSGSLYGGLASNKITALAGESATGKTFLVVLGTGLILSLIVSLLLVFTLNKLYKWRRKIDGGKSIVLPEVHYEKMESIESDVRSTGSLMQKLGDHVSSKATETEKNFEEFLSLLSKLQNTVETQDAEIARLKEGYDNKLKKDSVMILLKLRDRVDYFINSESSSEDLIKACNGILAIIDHELNAMDVVSFDFDSGVSIREIDDFEIIETVETADQEKIGLVIRTTKNGYYMKGQDDEKIILKKAEIECYKGE